MAYWSTENSLGQCDAYTLGGFIVFYAFMAQHIRAGLFLPLTKNLTAS